MLYGFRHIPSGFFLRLSGNTVMADGDLQKNNQGLLMLPDIWTAEQWQKNQLGKLPVEIVELEIHEVQVVKCVIEVEAKPVDETPGNQLSITPIVRP